MDIVPEVMNDHTSRKEFLTPNGNNDKINSFTFGPSKTTARRKYNDRNWKRVVSDSGRQDGFERLYKSHRPRKPYEQCQEELDYKGLQNCTFTPRVMSQKRYLSK
jgi:hypothetical protein